MTVLRAETNRAFSVVWATAEEMEWEGDGGKYGGGGRGGSIMRLKEWQNYMQWRTISPLFNSVQYTSVALLIVVIKWHTHTRRTTDSVLCQHQPTVCLFCCQSSKVTCGCQSVLCGMHGLAGNTKTAMVSTAVIIMTLEMKKFDAELKIKRPKHSVLTRRNATNFLNVKLLQDITQSEYIWYLMYSYECDFGLICRKMSSALTFWSIITIIFVVVWK